MNSIIYSMVLFPSQLCKCCIWQGDIKKFCRLLVEIVGNFNQSLTFTLIHLRARVQFHLYINTRLLFPQLGSHQVEEQTALFSLRNNEKGKWTLCESSHDIFSGLLSKMLYPKKKKKSKPTLIYIGTKGLKRKEICSSYGWVMHPGNKICMLHNLRKFFMGKLILWT